MDNEKSERHKKVMERLAYARQAFSTGKHELLTTEIAYSYQSRARALPGYPSDVGEVRKLKLELLERCGLTELEAYNVLLGNHVSDYVNKYKKILSGQAEAEEETSFKNIDKNKEKVKTEPVVYKFTESERDTFGWE